jgi:pimeloyl-ACP methyl ester carboxylesterase
MLEREGPKPLLYRRTDLHLSSGQDHRLRYHRSTAATPDAFDLLYWDSDSVSLPGPMYCWYTRNTYLENNIKVPGKTTKCGVPVDLSKIDLPIYLLASREDHIVPWKSAFRSKDLVGGEARFVLAASGHVAGSSILRLETNAAIGSTTTWNPIRKAGSTLPKRGLEAGGQTGMCG